MIKVFYMGARYPVHISASKHEDQARVILLMLYGSLQALRGATIWYL
jgi:hypothetical protein